MGNFIIGTKSSSGNSARVPTETDGIQVNYCKNPACSNYGVPPKKSVLTGGAAHSAQDSYILSGSGTGIPKLHCRACGEQPTLKSNSAIAEERARFLKDLVVCSEPSCPDEICPNHTIPVSRKGGYQSHGLTKSGSRRYRCNACKKTFSLGEYGQRY